MPHRRLRRPAAPVRRWTGAAGSVALLLTIAACGGGDASSDGTSRGSATPATAPTTTASTSTTTGPSGPTVATVPGVLGPVPPVAHPVRLRIGSIGVDAVVRAVGVEPDGDMEVPPATEIGWYRFGAAPGAGGSAVLAAHVDYDGRRGAFFRLRELPVGAEVSVHLDDGSARTFVVRSLDQVAKDRLDPGLFARDGEPRLALITCGGAFDRDARSYRDNIVAIAEAVG